MPNRILKESIKASAQIDSLSWFEEVLFYRLLVTADDYGCMDGRTILLRNELFPLKDNVTKKAVEDAIDHLASVGLLRKYEASGMPYLFFPTWEKHQRVRNQHRKYPEPPAVDLSDTCPSNDGQMTATCQPESNPIRIQSESESKRVTRFAPPSREEAESYCREKGISINLDAWFAYYEQNGWMVGRQKMKDWKASLRYWATKEKRPTMVKPGQTFTEDPENQAKKMERLKKLTAAMGGP